MRDLADAAIAGLSADRKFATAYNAALQTGTIAVACSGSRVSARSGHHKVTFEAAGIALGSEVAALADYFETCRRKRNIIDYMTSSAATDTEAEEIVERANEFRSAVEKWIRLKHPSIAPRAVSGAEARTATGEETKPEAAQGLLEAALERSNMMRAYQRVVENKGAPGVDGLTVLELKPWLVAQLAEDKAVSAGRRIHASGSAQGGDTQAARRGTHPGHSLCAGSFDPTGTSSATATSVDPGFSESSYGFRLGRNAHQAVNAARVYVAEGRRWTVDLDLEKFVDRVNHDVLMARGGRKVKDPGVLKLIRRYLEAGLMEGGIANARSEGTPQGSPLAPLTQKVTSNLNG